jgi:HEPN domain-containing protein
MNATNQARYRLRVAEGFLEEALQDMSSSRWRSCVENRQLAAEHAAKALLGLLGPVGRTHKPFLFLRRALAEKSFPEAVRASVERVPECAELLGPEVHVKSDYGDEESLRVPWDLFSQSDARQALDFATEAVRLAKEVVDRGLAS